MEISLIESATKPQDNNHFFNDMSNESGVSSKYKK